MTAILHTEPADRGPRGAGYRRDRAPPSLAVAIRAADFKTCPLLYRFRRIDRLPERPARGRRGTLVHAVLERLFDLPGARAHPAARAGCSAGSGTAARAAGARRAVRGRRGRRRRARRHAPSRLRGSPAELLDELLRGGGPDAASSRPSASARRGRRCDELLLRGYIDRLDVAPAGELRVVDYKTGGGAARGVRGAALFQLKFYALVLWRTRGVVAALLRLLYLGRRRGADLRARTPRNWCASSARCWRSGRRSSRPPPTGDFRPRPSKLCGWCDHQAVCPEFGGTPPPFPAEAADAAGWQTLLPVVERD